MLVAIFNRNDRQKSSHITQGDVYTQKVSSVLPFLLPRKSGVLSYARWMNEDVVLSLEFTLFRLN